VLKPQIMAPSLAVVLTCFNRCKATIACLTSLFSQEHIFKLNVYLVDDGCSDNTRAEVSRLFPMVNIITGSGQLFWGGGMHLAMQAADKDSFDYVLWLNDDVILADAALKTLLETVTEVTQHFSDQRFILVGATKSRVTGQTTYSGFKRTSRWHPARIKRIEPIPGKLTECDTLNGNIVLVSRQAYKALGPVDPVFRHELGDIDYGYRARKEGIRVLLIGNHLGFCEANPPRQGLRGDTLSERLKAISSPLEFPLMPWLVFLMRHGGALGFGTFLVMALKRYRELFYATG
jgi:GT2 family glycosyltransferase